MAKIISITEEGIDLLVAMNWWFDLSTDTKARLVIDNYPNTRICSVSDNQLIALSKMYMNTVKN